MLHISEHWRYVIPPSTAVIQIFNHYLYFLNISGKRVFLRNRMNWNLVKEYSCRALVLYKQIIIRILTNFYSIGGKFIFYPKRINLFMGLVCVFFICFRFYRVYVDFPHVLFSIKGAAKAKGNQWNISVYKPGVFCVLSQICSKVALSFIPSFSSYVPRFLCWILGFLGGSSCLIPYDTYIDGRVQEIPNSIANAVTSFVH